MADVPPHFYRQSAAIPFRRDRERTDILLITVRSGKRWIIPKGVIEPGTTAAESALAEAYEEAGARGVIRGGPRGSWSYEKWGGTCSVEVYAMEVETLLDAWPESWRARQWLPPEDAARTVDRPEVARMIRELADEGRRAR